MTKITIFTFCSFKAITDTESMERQNRITNH